MSYLVRFGLAFAISVVMTWLVRAAARKAGWVAKPRADRWHSKPTALYGGVAIFIGFFCTTLVLPVGEARGLRLLLLCSAAMFLLGLVDDRIQLKPYAKLVGQIIIATVFTMFGLRLHWLTSPVLDQALTLFWLVGITNAINLLDNLDGLAGGIAAIASGFMMYFCQSSGQVHMASVASAFAGATVGFLIFNFNPASIFMGDCGSLFLGFFLGGLSLVNTQPGVRQNVLAVLTIPALLLLIPIADTTLVTLSRKLNGRKVSQGGRDHTSHRLVALGLSERSAALTLWLLAAACGAVAVMVRQLSSTVGVIIVPIFGLALISFLVFVGAVKVYEPVEDEKQGAGRALLPTLADFSYKRRVFEVLHDLAIIVLAYYGAFLLRFDGELVQPHYFNFLRSLPLVIVVQLSFFLALGLYQGLWRYWSTTDLSSVLRAVGGGWVASFLAVIFVFRLDGFSRGMFVMNLMLLLFGITGSRISFRLLRVWLLRLRPESSDGRRVLIYGAGDGGELLLREILNNRDLGLLPVGFVDDDPQKQGRVIHGIRVLGSLDRLPELAAQSKVDEIVVSTTKLPSSRSEALVLACQTAGVQFRRMRIALE